jgi:hypothetical protein
VNTGGITKRIVRKNDKLIFKFYGEVAAYHVVKDVHIFSAAPLVVADIHTDDF